MSESFSQAGLDWDPSIMEIFVDAIHVNANLGIFALEKGRTQPLIVWVKAWAKVSVETDTMSETIDYNLFVDTARNMARDGHFHLVETFVESLVARLFENDARIQALEVRAVKPEAIAKTGGAGVSIRRLRPA